MRRLHSIDKATYELEKDRANGYDDQKRRLHSINKATYILEMDEDRRMG